MSALRRRLAVVVRALLHARLRLIYRVRGIEAINEQLLRTHDVEPILRQFNATIGPGCVLHGPLIIHNAANDYANLRIGVNAHVGRMVTLDLTSPLRIEDHATVSMGATILTHADVGDRPLSSRYPRVELETRLHAGSYLGANVTVLAGCHVGLEAVVGAGAVVCRAVPARAVVAGVPARELSTHAYPNVRDAFCPDEQRR